MKLKDLQPNARNPRTITDAKLTQLKKSLATLGDLSGIVYNRKSKTLVGGHQRLKVFSPDTDITITKKFAKPSKLGTVAEGYFEHNGERVQYREVYWSDAMEKAANIAANKGAGSWDNEILSEWLTELNAFDLDFDLDLTMFDSDEIRDLVGITVGEHQRTNSKTGVDEDEVPEKAPARSKLGDIYLLGEHRVMCGDSTELKSVERLMNGEKADITFTSPPYNLGNNAKLRGYNGDGNDTIYNEKSDHKSQDEYLTFLDSFTAIALKFSSIVFCNIQLLAGNKIAIPKYWSRFQSNLVDLMIWDKEHAAPQMAARVLNSVFEFIFILSNESMPKRSIKTGKEWRGTIDNIFRLNPNRGPREESKGDHGGTFPVAFAEHFAEHFAINSVYDAFGGTGSTLIACEKTNRKCFMMELDPHYVDVIVARWEKYTGLKAKLVRAETVTRKPTQPGKVTANGKSKSQAPAEA